MAGSCKHSKEPSDSINKCKFLDKLSDHQLPKKASVAELVLVQAIVTSGRSFIYSTKTVNTKHRNLFNTSGYKQMQYFRKLSTVFGTIKGPIFVKHRVL
jgi:hypothetical protein